MASTTVQSTTDNGADSHSSSTNQRGTGQTASPGRYGLGRRRCRAAFAYVALACSCSAAGVVPRAGAAAGPQQATPATEAEAGNDGVNGRKYVLRSGGNRSRRILAEKREALPPQCDGRQGQNDARLVYLDLGVNWANTLRLYRDIGVCSPDDPRWEIYGFEAMPLLHPYVNQVTNWLNGLQERPPMELPPAGSSADLGLFAKHFDCHNVPPFRKGYCLSGCKRCMAEKLHDKLGNLTVDPELEERRRVDAALALAARPNAPTTGRPRYAFVPAAVGVKDATMTLAVSRFQLLHGGAHPPDPKHYPATLKGLFLQEDFSVNSVNVVEWMVANFQRKDWVVVKMDIEGVEFDVFEDLFRRGMVCLIDVLIWQCHTAARPASEHRRGCIMLRQRISRECRAMKIIEETPNGASGYSGIDKATRAEMIESFGLAS
jgi:hypothetical protein